MAKDIMNADEIIDALEIPEDWNPPALILTGINGNVFNIIGATTRALKSEDKAIAQKYSTIIHNSDSYETVMSVSMRLCDVE